MNIEQQVSLLPDLPHLATDLLPAPRRDALGADAGAHAPRILLLYGSLRPQSYSRKLALEAQRILQHLGAETRMFDPRDLPMLDSVGRDHPKVRQLRERSEEHTSELQSLTRISYAVFCLNKQHIYIIQS